MFEQNNNHRHTHTFKPSIHPCAPPSAPTFRAFHSFPWHISPSLPPHLSPNTMQTPTPPASPASTPPLIQFISGWWILLITILTAFPWAIVAVWDAIDGDYRTRRGVAVRLLISSICLILAYLAGILFSAVLTIEIFEGREQQRHDEVATVLVLLAFNLWHVFRNFLGWSQFFAIRKLRPVFALLQKNFGHAFITGKQRVFTTGLDQLRISERLFDNEWRRDIAYLSPWFRYNNFHSHGSAVHQAWAMATWRAWWTQETELDGRTLDLTPHGYRVAFENLHTSVRDLMSTDPPDVGVRVVRHEGKAINTPMEWARALETYGGDRDQQPDGGSGGQQDTHGEPLPTVIRTYNRVGVAVLVHEKTSRVPNRMSALWYATSTFEELYQQKVDEMSRGDTNVLFPTWSGWLKIAQDIGTHLPRPVYLSDTQLINFAGELASASVILVKYHEKYKELVNQIRMDGLHARWTFGWSGLLACFTHLWTFERIYIAMLNGLSLLALSTTSGVGDIDENVRSMLYGYAAFEVSDRAVGKVIANDRKAELLKRYSLNKGKTCRGSGLCATRLACYALKIPAEASHMDGLPAFSTGWCSEYMERLPGNQTPAHGDNHDQVEAREGSSNVWRYPHSLT